MKKIALILTCFLLTATVLCVVGCHFLSGSTGQTEQELAEANAKLAELMTKSPGDITHEEVAAFKAEIRRLEFALAKKKAADGETADGISAVVQAVVPPPFGALASVLLTGTTAAMGIKSRRNARRAEEQECVADKHRAAGVLIAKSVNAVVAAAPKAARKRIKKLLNATAQEIVDEGRGRKPKPEIVVDEEHDDG